VILDDTKLPTHKTKEFEEIRWKNEWKSVLIVDDTIDRNLQLASSNVDTVDIIPQRGLNVYSILYRKTLVLSKAAVEKLQERLLEP